MSLAAVRGADRAVLLTRTVDVRGTTAEFRHVGVTVVSHDDILHALLELTHDPDSLLILRENRFDPATEVRIALPAGSHIIVDTQRLWHAATHHGDEPRYCLITSWESGPELDAYIAKYNGVNKVESFPVDQDELDAGRAEQARRIAARAAAIAARGQQEVNVRSEA